VSDGKRIPPRSSDDMKQDLGTPTFTMDEIILGLDMVLSHGRRFRATSTMKVVDLLKEDKGLGQYRPLRSPVVIPKTTVLSLSITDS
jgi:hypothetical protein